RVRVLFERRKFCRDGAESFAVEITCVHRGVVAAARERERGGDDAGRGVLEEVAARDAHRKIPSGPKERAEGTSTGASRGTRERRSGDGFANGQPQPGVARFRSVTMARFAALTF